MSVLIVTLVSFLFLWQGKLNVCAAKEGPPEQIERIFELTPEEILQVPKRIVEGMAVYELDEASIVVEETQNGSAEGANVIRFSKKGGGVAGQRSRKDREEECHRRNGL